MAADTVVFQSGTLATPIAGTPVAVDNCGADGVAQYIKLTVAAAGSIVPVPATAADGLLVNLGTNNDVTVIGTVTTTGGLTDTQLRATPVPVSGTVTATTGGLTDTQLRATPVPVSGTVTASGPLTDTELRATPVPVSGTVTATTGGLTDTQLRATPIPVSGTVAVTGSATEATLATRLSESDFDTKTGNLTETAPATDTASSGLNGRLQRIAQRITSLITALGSPFQAGGSIGNTSFGSTVADGGNVVEGAVADAAVSAGATGTISAKLRAISRDLIANIVLAAGGNVIGKVGIDQTTPGATNKVNIGTDGTVTANAGTNLNTSALLTESDFDAKTGSLTETAPATDTASSGLNGRLQRIAQRLTSLIALFPAALVSGRFDVNLGAAPATVTTKETRPTGGGPANVSASATSVTLIASNANRLGATIWNDSSAILYVKFGATASATSCHVKMVADAYYEVPFGYTGIIDGIWASATGSARIGELT